MSVIEFLIRQSIRSRRLGITYQRCLRRQEMLRQRRMRQNYLADRWREINGGGVVTYEQVAAIEKIENQLDSGELILF